MKKREQFISGRDNWAKVAERGEAVGGKSRDDSGGEGEQEEFFNFLTEAFAVQTNVFSSAH